MQETLTILQSVQGSVRSLQDLQQQLDESKAILARKMNNNAQSSILQILIHVMLASDEEDANDLILSNQQMDSILQKFQDVRGVHTHDAELRQFMIDHGRGMTAVLEVARHVLFPKDVVPTRPGGTSLFSYDHDS
jgi:hypothetical protein